MGQKSGVDIIPDSQLEAIDATEAAPGVAFAGVPGAGGYDALFALYLSPSQEGRQRIESLWSSWSEGGALICPLMLQAETSRSGVQEEELAWE